MEAEFCRFRKNSLDIHRPADHALRLIDFHIDLPETHSG